MAPQKAAQKLVIINPPTTPLTIMSMTPLITNVNSPNVKILIGSVRTKKTGLMKAFNTPNNAEAKRAEAKLSTWIPVTRRDAIRSDTALKSHASRI